MKREKRPPIVRRCGMCNRIFPTAQELIDHIEHKCEAAKLCTKALESTIEAACGDKEIE